jgi:hypothetical protein
MNLKPWKDELDAIEPGSEQGRENLETAKQILDLLEPPPGSAWRWLPLVAVVLAVYGGFIALMVWLIRLSEGAG